jgi:hypothetical protein
MVADYPTLVEALMAFKRYSLKVQAQLQGKSDCRDMGERPECVIASQYYLKYDVNNDYFYCLNKNQNRKYLPTVV